MVDMQTRKYNPVRVALLVIAAIMLIAPPLVLLIGIASESKDLINVGFFFSICELGLALFVGFVLLTGRPISEPAPRLINTYDLDDTGNGDLGYRG